MGKKTYTIKVKCTNCGQYTSNIEIEKGVSVYNELQFRECPVCGCRELEMVGRELIWTNTSSTDDMVSTGGYTPELLEEESGKQDAISNIEKEENIKEYLQKMLDRWNKYDELDGFVAENFRVDLEKTLEYWDLRIADNKEELDKAREKEHK